MIRKWCDACEVEVTNDPHKQVEIPCHLFSFKGRSGYQDNKGMPTSGRSDSILLCSECWNRGYSALLQKLNLPREEHIHKR